MRESYWLALLLLLLLLHERVIWLPLFLLQKIASWLLLFERIWEHWLSLFIISCHVLSFIVNHFYSPERSFRQKLTMSEQNPACRIHWDVRARDIVCEDPIECHPTDMTRIPLRVPPAAIASTKNPFCGCPREPGECWECYTPKFLETRILRPPLMCYKPPCNFAIPAVSCQEPRRP